MTTAALTPQQVAEMTEEEAFTTLYRMTKRFRWVVAAWSLADLEPEADDDDEDGGDTIELNSAMMDAVADTWEWRKGMGDRAAEHGSQVCPVVRVRKDGSFTVVGIDEERRYTAHGERLPDAAEDVD
jgi:hypothetical protein